LIVILDKTASPMAKTQSCILQTSDVAELSQHDLNNTHHIILSYDSLSLMSGRFDKAIKDFNSELGIPILVSSIENFIDRTIREEFGDRLYDNAHQDIRSVYRHVFPIKPFWSSFLINVGYIAKTVNNALNKSLKLKENSGYYLSGEPKEFSLTSKQIIYPLLQVLRDAYINHDLGHHIPNSEHRHGVGLRIYGIWLNNSNRNDDNEYDYITPTLTIDELSAQDYQKLWYNTPEVKEKSPVDGSNTDSRALTSKNLGERERLLWAKRRDDTSEAKLTPPEFIKKHYADLIAQGSLTETVIRQSDPALFLAFYRWQQRHPNKKLDFSVPKQREVTADRYRERYGKKMGELILNAVREEGRIRANRSFQNRTKRG
jgi:hypothetical protein